MHGARGEAAAAVALMRRAQALAPDDLDVLTALGAALMQAGAAGEGAPLLERVVADNPRRYDAQLPLAEHAARQGRWARAAAAYQAYLASRPASLATEDPARWVDLADALLRGGDPAAALRWTGRARSARPDELRAQVAEAWALAATDCRRARPALAEVAERAPALLDVALVDGRCALAMGDAAGALAQARRVLAAVPRADAHVLAGEALAARGDLDGARAELARRRARAWAATVVLKLSRVLRRAGQAAAAVAELDALGPPATVDDDPAWWRELGWRCSPPTRRWR
ncbi:MAG: tetratricopeptide repeat protein [Kofleriaceae bacterium]